jgi:ADP-ribose pyrophosphatase YjhB (NUDIX family)
MKVKVRAVILDDHRLVVTEERRQTRHHYSLPGGRVSRWETAEEALVREVAEETGLSVEVERLLYVAEATRAFRAHDLILVFLARPHDGAHGEALTVPLDQPNGSLLPPILDMIAADAATGWRDNPRWLGNVWRGL